MGTMTWIYTDYPLPKPPPPPTTPFGRCNSQSPERRWDARGASTALESHRKPEPEPPVTLRCNLEAETVERDFFPAFCCDECPDDRAN